MASTLTSVNLGPCGFCASEAKVKCANCKSTYYCDRNCQKRDWKTHKKSCNVQKIQEVTKLVEPLDSIDVSNLNLKVQLAEKSNNGYGVFTSDFIKKGEKICFYDGQTKDASIKIRLRKLPNSSHITIVDAEKVFTQLLVDQSIKCLAHPSKSGYVKIASDNKYSFGVGQWINDGAKPELNLIGEDFSLAIERLNEYQDLSLLRCNVQVKDDFWFEATKDIETDTELFVHYGFQFWLNQFMLNSNIPSLRFFYYSLHDQSTQIFNLQKFYEYDDETCINFLKYFIQMPQESIDKHSNVKELLFDLTMRNVDVGCR